MAVTTNHIAQWGVGQKSGATSGVVTSFERIDDSMFQQETDTKGAVCRMKKYDSRHRIVFTVQAAASTEPPETGANMTVAGQQGWVVHAEVIEQNRAFKKIRVTLESYAGCKTAD